MWSAANWRTRCACGAVVRCGAVLGMGGMGGRVEGSAAHLVLLPMRPLAALDRQLWGAVPLRRLRHQPLGDERRRQDLPLPPGAAAAPPPAQPGDLLPCCCWFCTALPGEQCWRESQRHSLLATPAPALLQIWLTPDQQGHQPQYGSTSYTAEDRHNRLLHILGGTGAAPAWQGVHSTGECIRLHQVRAGGSLN